MSSTWLFAFLFYCVKLVLSILHLTIYYLLHILYKGTKCSENNGELPSFCNLVNFTSEWCTLSGHTTKRYTVNVIIQLLRTWEFIDIRYVIKLINVGYSASRVDNLLESSLNLYVHFLYVWYLQCKLQLLHLIYQHIKYGTIFAIVESTLEFLSLSCLVFLMYSVVIEMHLIERLSKYQKYIW